MTVRTKRLLIVIVFYFVLLALFSLLFMPYAHKLSDPEFRAVFRERIQEAGICGILFVYAIQVVQVVIAFIPGEAVEILCGALYGGLQGLLFCLAGTVSASTLVFFLARKFGAPFLRRILGENETATFAFFRESDRLETVTFILFLIPGTPKDALTYVAALSPIKLPRFLLISSFARIPSIITSTYAGAALGNGNLTLSAILFAVTGIIGLAGIKYRDRILNRLHKKKERAKKNI